MISFMFDGNMKLLILYVLTSLIARENSRCIVCSLMDGLTILLPRGLNMCVILVVHLLNILFFLFTSEMSQDRYYKKIPIGNFSIFCSFFNVKLCS